MMEQTTVLKAYSCQGSSLKTWTLSFPSFPPANAAYHICRNTEARKKNEAAFWNKTAGNFLYYLTALSFCMYWHLCICKHMPLTAR